ncbi:MAG: DsbE family thiol:disulfide interchange protein [Alcaligenaceae bacterium]|nr:DsbE family thiol:disulfide interchange protein [Alcaligenaceae bacterium]
MWLKRFWPLLLLGSLVLLLAIGLGRGQKPLSSALVGKPMPSFDLPSLKNQNQSYDESLFKGQIFVLNVWASWCEACQYEHKIFVEQPLPEEVVLVGLNYKDQTGPALRWLRDLGDPYRLSLQDESGRLGLDLGVYGVPETYVINEQGIITHRHVGAFDDESWTQNLLPAVQRALEQRQAN